MWDQPKSVPLFYIAAYGDQVKIRARILEWRCSPLLVGESACAPPDDKLAPVSEHRDAGAGKASPSPDQPCPSDGRSWLAVPLTPPPNPIQTNSRKKSPKDAVAITLTLVTEGMQQKNQ
jgi:hypothetical protein